MSLLMMKLMDNTSITEWKMSKYRVSSSDWILKDTEYVSAFNPNAGKYGPEKTPDLDKFHAVYNFQILRYNLHVV